MLKFDTLTLLMHSRNVYLFYTVISILFYIEEITRAKLLLKNLKRIFISFVLASSIYNTEIKITEIYLTILFVRKVIISKTSFLTFFHLIFFSEFNAK